MDLDYGDGLPILLPYQSRWIAEQAPVAVCEKSRRVGLSWSDASDRVIHAAEGAGDVVYASYSKDMTHGYVKDCAAWAERLGRACSEVLEETLIEDERKVQIYRILFPSGKRIESVTSAARALRSIGRPGDVAVIDEAAFLDDLAAVLKAVMAVTMWGGKVRVISTHNGADNPFAAVVEDIRARRLPYALHRITLDDAIADGLARRICSVKGDRWHDGYEAAWRELTVSAYGDDADEELHCIPSQGSGAWLSRALVESRMHDAPVLRFNGSAAFNGLPPDAREGEVDDWLFDEARPLLAALAAGQRHVFGMDFARSGDLSVYLPLAIGEDLVRRCPFCIEMRNVPHQQQVQVIRFATDRLPRFCGGAIDASGNGSYVAEAAADLYGSAIEQVKMSESWYVEHMPPYKAAFEDGTILLPRSDAIVQDHRAVKLVRGVPRLPAGKTDGDGERHGDSAIAGALAWQASVSDAGPIEFESDGPRASSGGLDAWLGDAGPAGGMMSGWA